MCSGTVRSVGVILSLLCAVGFSSSAQAQVSGPPSTGCHVTDGQFTPCASGPAEWSDVQPIPFPATNSFLYVNQDSAHAFLYLMYDFPFRTGTFSATDAVHISFDTVEQGSAGPTLVVYDIYIFGNGQLQLLKPWQPTPPGRITGAAGFGVSPNSSTPHVMAELQVPLLAGPPSTYSPDPLFWGASVPPSPPPDPCPTDPGKTYNRCVKAELNNAQANAAEMAMAVGLAAGLCSTVGALACGPLEPVMLVTAAVWTATSIELNRKLGADPPGINFAVPPDPNFTVIAQPAVYSLSIPTAGLTQQEADAFNAFAVNAQQLIALEQATTTALARVEGASLAGNTVWVTAQMQAAQTFGGQSGVLLGQLPGLFANIGTAIQAAGIQFTFTPNDVLAFQAAINPNSATSEVQQQFVLAQQLVAQQLGISSEDQALGTQLLLLQDPLAVSTFGTGAFPSSLADPVIDTTFRALGSGLISNAPSPTSLTNSFKVTLPGDYVAAGVGLRGQTGGTINISGIPSGASIVRAFLYWGMLDNGEDTSLHQMNLDGTAISGSLIGAGRDTCWGLTNSFSYRAEVTPQITGNGSYTLTGVAAGGNILAEGASLVVIYELAGAPVKTVMLDDGNLPIPFGTPSGSATFAGFTATSPIAATTSFMVGDGQEAQFNIQTPTSFTGSAGTINFPNLFNSLDGPLWDTSTFDVSSVVGAGISSDTANITIAGDCLLWSAQAFSVTSAPDTTAITATAGVVEADASGNTVVNLRGLAPGDAPTIQDQLVMIVQSRTIKNPSISGPDLTTQLVNGLVNDGIVPPGQASSLLASVLQKLVVSTASTLPPSIVPSVSGQLGANGWYTGPVTVTWVVTDAISGIASSNGCTPTTLSTNTAGTLLTCTATNKAGLSNAVSVTIKIDQTPPSIAPVVNGPSGANGWYTGAVAVAWTVSGSVSGIASSTGCSPSTLTTNTTGTTLTCLATSGAGLSSTVVLVIKIDTTPPTTSCAASPTILWPPNGKPVVVVLSGAISDTTSGVDPTGASYAVTDEYGQVQPSGSIALRSGGSYSFGVSLIASREGGDLDGRTYTIVVTGKNLAGKVGSCSAVVTVPHDQRK